MDLQKLRYFAVLADELHFGRAAARLYLSQPAMSNAIRALERELGVRLFERSSRRVELTEAGAALLPQAQQLIADADALQRSVQAHRARPARSPRLRLAFVGQGANELTPALLRAVTEADPAADVELRQVPAWDVVEEVRQDRADVGVLRLPVTTEGLVVAPLFEEPRVAVVPAEHWATACEQVQVERLFDEPWVVAAAEDQDYQAFARALPQRGSAPFIAGPTVHGVDEYLEAVLAGRGIGLAPLSAARFYGRPGIAFVPVPDAEPSVVALAWAPGSAAGLTWGPLLVAAGAAALRALPPENGALMRAVDHSPVAAPA